MATGSMTPGERFERSFAQDDRNAPRHARGAIATLPGIDERLRRDLTIVVSELVANAVRHAPPVPGGEVSLAVIRAEDAVRVEVTDPGSGFDPTPDPTRPGGLGLVIVSHLARDWGVTDGACTIVWCELPVPAREWDGSGG